MRTGSRRTRWARVANVVAGLLLVGLVIALWRDPTLVIRGEFAKQRLLIGAKSHEVVVAGHRWTYSEIPADKPAAGKPDAPTVVMVHGFTGSKENWYRMAKALRGRYRLVMPDLPGWGQSERHANTDYGFVAQSKRLAPFLAVIDNKPVVLLGHSMGGGIAALTAAAHPERVSHLGLIDAAGVRFEDNQFGIDVLAGKNPFAVTDEASLERYFDVVFGDASARPWLPWPAKRIYIAQRKRDAAFEQGVLERIGRSDERFLPGAAATDITQPTLLLWCAQDRVIDPSAMGLYAQAIPQANQVLLEGCGHMLPMERPGEAAAAVTMLIDRGRGR